MVADHGFRAVKEQINADVLLKANGLIRRAGSVVRCEAWAIPERGAVMVYVTDPTGRAELVPRLTQMLAAVEGVERVYGPAVAIGVATPGTEVAVDGSRRTQITLEVG